MNSSIFNLDKNIVLYSILIILLCVLTSFYLSIFTGVIILSSCALGLACPFIVLRNREIPDLIHLFQNKLKDPTGPVSRTCSICDEGDCCRQQSIFLSSSVAQAHVNFTVSLSFDRALEELMTLILENFVYDWYKDISVGDQFVDDVRYAIRFASTSVGYRLSKVDLHCLIMNRLLPYVVDHMNAYVTALEEIENKNELYELHLKDIEKTHEEKRRALERLALRLIHKQGSLHPALLSRTSEQDYLRNIFLAVYPYIVPVRWQESQLTRLFLRELFGGYLLLQGMDLLADPDNVNFLLLQLLNHRDDGDSKLFETDNSPVLLLKAFSVSNTNTRESAFKCDLSNVLKNQALLYLFHNFLKEEGAITILSFCLAVEDFNRHILNPDLTPDQLKSIRKDGLELYHTYMSSGAVCRINFPKDIVAGIKEAVHGDAENIVKLRTTRPLFQAYEFCYNLLEKEYMPYFLRSELYFSYMLDKVSIPSQRKTSRTTDSSSSSLASASGVGIKVVRKVSSGLVTLGRQMSLKPQVVLGGEDNMPEVLEATELGDTPKNEEKGISSNFTLEGFSHAFRDLSAWRVCIPAVEQTVTGSRHSQKIEFFFVIDVRRVDVTGEASSEDMHWIIHRRYHEFYVLEAKLVEFHGKLLSDVSLPSRKSVFSSAKGNYSSFMHSRREVFEEYLQKLLQKPFLKSSQLLFLFFKSKDEFSASLLPDFSLAAFLKEVPRKLLKEKGQYLEPFISKFIKSLAYKSNVGGSSKDFDFGPEIDSPIADLLGSKEHPLEISELFGDNASFAVSSSEKNSAHLHRVLSAQSQQAASDYSPKEFNHIEESSILDHPLSSELLTNQFLDREVSNRSHCTSCDHCSRECRCHKQPPSLVNLQSSELPSGKFSDQELNEETREGSIGPCLKDVRYRKKCLVMDHPLSSEHSSNEFDQSSNGIEGTTNRFESPENLSDESEVLLRRHHRSSKPKPNLRDLTDIAFFIAVRVYKLSLSWMQWLLPLKMVFGRTLNSYLSQYLERKLNGAVDTPSLVSLVHAIRDVLFNNSTSDLNFPEQSNEEKLRITLNSLIPTWLDGILLNRQSISRGNDVVVDLFQHPVLNKQLCYLLLDEILRELFPELN